MVLNNKEVLDLYTKLNRLREDASMRFPASVSYAIIHNIRSLSTLAEDVYRVRNTFVSNNSDSQVPLEDGSIQYHISPENLESVTKQLDDFWAVQNEVNITTIPYSFIKDLELSLPAMDALYPMIVMEE